MFFPNSLFLKWKDRSSEFKSASLPILLQTHSAVSHVFALDVVSCGSDLQSTQSMPSSKHSLNYSVQLTAHENRRLNLLKLLRDRVELVAVSPFRWWLIFCASEWFCALTELWFDSLKNWILAQWLSVIAHLDICHFKSGHAQTGSSNKLYVY